MRRIPPATQIIDSHLDVWTVSGGQVFENAKPTPSSGVILVLYALGSVYQENTQHDWWLWSNGAWKATTAPALTASASPTTIPSATQIIDSYLNVWTLSGGQAYENGQPTTSNGVILLLYAAGSVYQENLHHSWWLWNNGVWVATSAPLVTPSTQAPTQVELNQSDTDTNWLTSNKGYLGYRYSSLAHVNDQDMHALKRICSFANGEKGSFPGALTVYQGLLYSTTAFSIFAIDAASCQKRWSYTHTPDSNTTAHNNRAQRLPMVAYFAERRTAI